jgi:hypothetical protein
MPRLPYVASGFFLSPSGENKCLLERESAIQAKKLCECGALDLVCTCPCLVNLDSVRVGVTAVVRQRSRQLDAR